MEDQLPDEHVKCCMNCKWYNKRNLFCQYNPPSVLMQYVDRIPRPTAVWPRIPIPQLDVCSKFKFKDEEEWEPEQNEEET